jgi:hypothetical protein
MVYLKSDHYNGAALEADVVILGWRSEVPYATHSLRVRVPSFLAIHYVASLITKFVRLDPG